MSTKILKWLRFIAPRLRTDGMKKYSIELFKETNDLNYLVGTIMTGKEFNDLAKNRGIVFIKLLLSNEKHNGLQLVEGLNVDPNIFDPDCDCCPGGIYFTESNKKDKWLCSHTHVRGMIIPDDATVKIELDKIKATSIILGEVIFWIVEGEFRGKNKE